MHEVAKSWSCSFSIIPSKEHTGLIFRIDWLDLLAVQGTHKSLLQNHSSKASILWCSAFFIVLTSIRDLWKNHKNDYLILNQRMENKVCHCFHFVPIYFGHLMQRVDSLEKNLMLGGVGGRRRRGRQRMRCLDGIPDSMDVSLGELQSW